jgi:DNA polymerase-3 subunit epsilon
MISRQIVLDTETTGLRVEEGHRVIEIACIEMIDRKLTGREFHYYVNPERVVDTGALAIHGITNEFLQDKPPFQAIAAELITFITGAELIIHNAPFDVAFLNHELSLSQQKWKSLIEYCRIVDTLTMARSLHIGQRNNLDALCKRYSIDNSKRDLHGALLDAYLLAQVYLAMTGGQSDFFATLSEEPSAHLNESAMLDIIQNQSYHLTVLKAEKDEIKNHEHYLEMMLHQGKCRWLDDLNE